MKSHQKLPIETKIILILFILGILFTVPYIIPMPTFINGTILGATVKVNPTDEQMEQIKQSNNRTAIKTQENGKYYLYLYGDYMNGKKVVGKYALTKEQYDKISLNGRFYWFEIKYKKINDIRSGTVKKVYVDNPIR